jgi:hypothetical protein
MFKLGNEPWNKGLTGCKCGNKKGYIPWNTGLTKEDHSSIAVYARKESKTKKRLYREGKLVHCSKGKKFPDNPYNWGKYKRTKSIRIKNSENRIGKCVGSDNPNYRGGADYGHPYDWPERRRRALKRVGYRCEGCGVKQSNLGYRLHIHHIISSRVMKEHGLYPHPLKNLMCLCRNCHCYITGNYPKFKDIVRPANIDKMAELTRNELVVRLLKKVYDSNQQLFSWIENKIKQVDSNNARSDASQQY